MRHPEGLVTKELRAQSQAEQYKQASMRLYGVVGEVNEAIEAAGKDPDQINVASYWLAVANRSRQVSTNEYSTMDTLGTGKALEVAALVPAYFIAHNRVSSQSRLNRADRDQDELDRCRYLLSSFNGLVADYARINPGLSATELNQQLSRTLHTTLEVPEQAGSAMFSKKISGMQHEVAAGDILAAIGKVRPSTTEEDMQGIDYILKIKNGHGIPIDIKGSWSSVGKSAHSPDPVEWTIHNKKLITHSLMSSEELNDRFHAPSESLDVKAARMRAIVASAVKMGMIKPVTF